MNTVTQLSNAIETVFTNCTDTAKDRARNLTYEHLQNITLGMKARKNIPWKLNEDQSYEQVLDDFFLHSDTNDRAKLIQYLGWTKTGLEADPKYA